MDYRAITLQRLQAFCAAYERGSFSAAARMLAISQPTVSKHLRDLETALRMSLFVLEGGRVAPTADADWLYSECKFLSEGVRAIAVRIHEHRTGVGQRLSVACVGLLMHRYLPEALARLLADMPGLEVNTSIRTSLEQLSALRAGQSDVGFCVGRVNATDLYQHVIGRGHLVLLLPLGHPRADCTRIDPAELRGIDELIGMPLDRPIGQLLQPYLNDGPSGMSCQVTCYSLEAMAPLSRQLRRAAVVDCFTASAIRDEDIRKVPFDPAITFDIHAIAARPFSRLRPERALADAMEQLLAGGTSSF